MPSFTLSLDSKTSSSVGLNLTLSQPSDNAYYMARLTNHTTGSYVDVLFGYCLTTSNIRVGPCMFAGLEANTTYTFSAKLWIKWDPNASYQEGSATTNSLSVTTDPAASGIDYSLTCSVQQSGTDGVSFSFNITANDSYLYLVDVYSAYNSGNLVYAKATSGSHTLTGYSSGATETLYFRVWSTNSSVSASGWSPVTAGGNTYYYSGEYQQRSVTITSSGGGGGTSAYLWSWSNSSGSWNDDYGNATSSMLQSAYDAITGNGATTDFHHTVWNDMVDCVDFGLTDAGFGTVLSGCYMSSSDTVLTYYRFATMVNHVNALADWIGTSRVNSELSSVSRGDAVYGWYFTELMQKYNDGIDATFPS